MPKENIFCNEKEDMSTKFTRYQENELIILPFYNVAILQKKVLDARSSSLSKICGL